MRERSAEKKTNNKNPEEKEELYDPVNFYRAINLNK